jgi:hypothetical protein
MEMDIPGRLLAQRVAIRNDYLDAIASVARRSGATALHVIGSLGRSKADALSDIDVWLTFPDAAMGAALRDRWRLYGAVGEVLLTHEMAPNRPPGGAYTLVLYATAAGPLQVDWYLAPQASSRIGPSAHTVFAHAAVPAGDLPTDGDAEHVVSPSERISWLACMLFVAVKAVARGGSRDFLGFLGEAYRDVCEAYAFEGIAVTEPISLAAVGTMLRQLDRYADDRQRRALRAIDDFQREVGKRAWARLETP